MSLITKTYLFLLLGMTTIFGGDPWQDKQEPVSFKMVLSKSTMGINERIRVDFVMNKDGDNFVPPSFEGFRVVMGPSQAISSSWVNGVRSFSKTFSYTIAPSRKGNLTLSQAQIEIDGTTYKTSTQKVTVTDAVKKPSEDMTAEDVANENLYLVAEVSKANPYLNEMVTVVYKLYVGAGISVTNFRPVDNPTFNNFWNQDIPVTQYTFQSGTYKGKSMQYVALKKVVLYPQKTGELQLEPLVLDVTAEVPTNRRDFFGGRLYAQTNKTVTAGNRTIQVKPLPEAGRPASFSGAVGKFDFFVRTSKNILNANESLQAVVEVNGNGNLKLFQVPELKLPAALEVYEPEFEEKITTNLSGMRGKISNSYTVVPAYKGKYPIPSVAFSYFDPSLEKYITLNATPVLVNVIEGPTFNENTTAITATKQAVAENNAFGFIKTKTTLIPVVQIAFFNSKPFWLLYLLPFAVLLITVLTHRLITTKKTDQASVLSKRAQRLAKKFLSEAKGKKADKDAFYVALEKGLQLYLKGKLKLDNADFNKENIYNIFNKKSILKETTGLLITLLEHCEAARYSPFTAVEIEADYLNAISAISQLDTQI
tara:strand:+ start:1663 stop:3444 length:1782 start_codon:yes stop_codon:yes gene_type:complete